MSGVLNNLTGEQGLLRGHCIEVASRARVNHLEESFVQDARVMSGAGADDCEWGVRKTLGAPLAGPCFLRVPVTLPVVFENLIAP